MVGQEYFVPFCISGVQILKFLDLVIDSSFLFWYFLLTDADAFFRLFLILSCLPPLPHFLYNLYFFFALVYLSVVNACFMRISTLKFIDELIRSFVVCDHQTNPLYFLPSIGMRSVPFGHPVHDHVEEDAGTKVFRKAESARRKGWNCYWRAIESGISDFKWVFDAGGELFDVLIFVHNAKPEGSIRVNDMLRS